MGLILQNQALTLPYGTEFPGTPQELMDLIAEYLAIVGGSDFNGVNYGDTTPAPADQDKAWMKTDGSGNVLGWFGWDGSAWSPFPNVIPSGVTGARPSTPAAGQQFFDTTIGAAIVFVGGVWTTLSGTSGDIKHVAGTTLASVLTKNPGWSHYTDGIGSVLAGALADGSNAETNAGADTHTLTVNEMPAHTHEDLIVTGSEADNGDIGNYVVTAATQSVGQETIANSLTGTKGGGVAFDTRQATRYVFCLIKD